MEPQQKKQMGWPMAAVAVVLILAFLVGIGIWKAASIPGETGSALVREIMEGVSKIAKLEPKIVINDRTYSNQIAQIAELATASQEFTVEREKTNVWLHSTKYIRLRAVYEAKAGFNLKEPFVVQVDTNTSSDLPRLRFILPPPRLLSVEQKEIELMSSENGLWNKVKPAEITDESNALNEKARLKAESSQLLQDASESLREQLRKAFEGRFQLEFTEQKQLH